MMDPPNGAVQAPGRGRPRKRLRVSETGSTMSNPNQQQHPQNLNQQVQHPHAQRQHGQHTQWTHDTVRGTDQDTAVQHQHQHQHQQHQQQHHHPTYPSQQLDTRSHQVQVSDANGLMNGYGAAPHSQYPNTSPNLAYAPADVTGLGSQQALQQTSQSQAQHRRTNVAVAAATANQSQDNQVSYYSGTSVTPATTAAAAAAAAAAVSSPLPPNNTSYSLTSNWAPPGPPPSNTTTTTTTNNNANTTPMMSQVNMAQSPAGTGTSGSGALQPPPEGIYRTFEELMQAVQLSAKDQGYGVVKLRASNYRDVGGAKPTPTRYDLVCDRGGVKYNSTAKKRNPSTRKIDCPWRAKAVCEVQLSGQWRFVVQEPRHNHEARVATVAPGQEATPVERQLKSLQNKIDRLMHEGNDHFARLSETINNQGADFATRLENIERRLEALEASGRSVSLLGATGGPSMQTMTSANMGNGTLTNGGMDNGIGGGGMNTGMGNPGMGGGGGMNGMGNGVMDQGRLSNMEARLNAMEQRQNMDGMPMMGEDPTRVNSMLL